MLDGPVGAGEMEPSAGTEQRRVVAAYEEGRQTTTRVANRSLQTSSVACRER